MLLQLSISWKIISISWISGDRIIIFNFWSPANWQNHSISWSKNFLSPVLISWNLISWSPVLQKIPHFTNANDNVTWSKHCSFFLSFFSKFEGRNRRDLALHYGGPQHFVFQKLLVRNYWLGFVKLGFVRLRYVKLCFVRLRYVMLFYVRLC